MTPARIGKALAVLLFLHPRLSAAGAEPSIAVTTTPNPAVKSLQLQITVEAALTDKVVQPTYDAPDFIITGSPRIQPIFNSDFNPNTRKKLIYTWVLMPRHPGDLLIKNISTRVEGKTLTSADVHVVVKPDTDENASNPAVGGAAPAPSPPSDDESTNPAAPNYPGAAVGSAGTKKGPSSVPDRFNSDFTVWMTASKTKVYVGEPFVVEYYLYDLGGIQGSPEVLQWPNFNGFWREDLELVSQLRFEDLYANRQEVRRALIARYALYGIKPGRIALDKLGIRAHYLPSDILHPALVFGMDLRVGEHYSQDMNVEVIPLPEAGRPANFGGAVGRFTLRLEADKTTLAQNTPITFTATIEGEGNFQAIDALKLPLPPDFELYGSTAIGRPVVAVNVRQELASKKAFQTVAIPRRAGHFEIPSITWSYFNPEKVAYQTLTTNPIQIEVTPNETGAGNSNTYLSPTATNAASDGQHEHDDFRFLKPLDLSRRPGNFSPLSIAVYFLLAVNLILAIRLLRGRSRGLVRLVRGIDRFSEARIVLLQAKGIREGDWQASLEEVVLMTMQVLLDTNPRGLPRHDLEDAWKNRGLPAPLFQRASALLDEIDRHRFSSQKLAGSGSREVRSRLTKEAENFLSEASALKRR